MFRFTVQFCVIINCFMISLEGQKIVKQKCAQYKTLVDKIYKPISSNQTVLDTLTIIGGLRTSIGEFPHMVALGFGEKDFQWQCGATLVEKDYVITAAHCTKQRELGSVKIAKLGTIFLNSNDDVVQNIKIKKIIVHPDYQPPSQYNDIAILQLENSVEYSKAIIPACIYTENDLTRFPMLALGWGRLEYAGQSSNELMKVNLQFYSYNECQKSYESVSRTRLANGIDQSTQFCAGDPNHEEKDTCQGDSGGPMQLQSSPIHVIVGITSFGKACGISGTPGIYTKLAAYVPWIEKTIWPNGS